MLKKYFEDDSYNIMPCGVVAFQNDSTLKIISANDYYYSTYANGNFESLNICEEDKNNIADLKDKNEVVYKCIVSDGTIRYVCMHLTKYNENDILGILIDVTEQHTNLVRMKDERRCFTYALKSSKNIVFEHNVADDNMTLYIPVKGQTELKKLSIPNNTEDAVYELADKRDYGYLKENIYNEKVENISVRMKLPGNKNYEWHRIFRNFEHDEKGNLKRIFGTITNIEDEKHHEKELKEKIEIDPVLHVYNRNAGVERINEYIKSNPESRDYALFVIDIDDFKNINDTYGHLYGDTVIAMVAEMLNKATDDDAIVGRYGGDEFFVFLKSSRIAENADRVVDNVCKINISEDKRITCSVGVADGRIFEEVPNYKALFSKADKALYYVKQNGKGSYFFYQQMENEESGSAGTGKDLKMIAKALHDSGKYSGVFNLDYRGFARVFEYMNHLSARYKYEYHLVMVTMETQPDSAPHIESIEEALECMEHVICKKIRSVDVCTRYSSMQYLIILFETEESKIKDIMERIFTQYRKEYKGTPLLPKYEYISMMKEEKKETQV